MDNKQLAPYQPKDFDEIARIGLAMVKSGYFNDVKDVAQATVKVMAGAELGLPPFTSMTGIHIIKGKPALGANVIATLIKNDPRYNYRVTQMDDDLVSINFYEGGELIGTSSFSAADAQKAGTQNMHKYPRNMLFARAISNGARWYTPGIFGGSPVYTPDELGVSVDEDGYIDALPEQAQNDFTEGEFETVEEEAPAAPVKQNGNHNPASNGVTPDEYKQAAYASASLKDMAQNVVGAKVGYDAIPHVINAMTETYANEVLGGEQFFYKREHNKAYVDWLIERKTQTNFKPAGPDVGDGGHWLAGDN